MISWIFLLSRQCCALLLEHAMDTDQKTVLDDIGVNVIHMIIRFAGTDLTLLSHYKFLEALRLQESQRLTVPTHSG